MRVRDRAQRARVTVLRDHSLEVAGARVRELSLALMGGDERVKRNILVVGDVGAWSVLHAGDEAMLDAAVTEMSARLDVRWTVVSADPVESAARYGIPAVPHFGFPAGASDQLREARLVEILEVPLEVAASGGTSVRPSRDVRLCNRARMSR